MHRLFQGPVQRWTRRNHRAAAKALQFYMQHRIRSWMSDIPGFFNPSSEQSVCIRYVSTRGRRHLRQLDLQSPTGYGPSPIGKCTDGADETSETIVGKHS
jgi:hypothetical protein